MKLQEKTLLLFVILLISVLVATSVFFSTILLANYSALEEHYIEKDLSQAVHLLNAEFLTLSAIVSDWAPWDDTYTFVQGTKPEYLQSNLQPTTFDNLNLNLIVITNDKGEEIYSGAYDLRNRTMVLVPPFFSSPLDPANPLMNMSDPRYITAGILLLSPDPMIVVSQPITRSDFSGQPRGVIIMGRYLTRAEISRLAELTVPSLEFIRIDDPALSPALVTQIREKHGSAPGIILRQNEDQIAGAALIKDIYGNDALVLRITESRDIYREGKNSTVQALIVILTGGLVLGLFVIFLLDHLVLKRLHALTDQVYTIGKSGSTVDHVEIEGDDELSGLAREINRMLDTLEITRQKVQASEARFREFTNLLPQSVFEMDREGNISYLNKFARETFGFSEQDLIRGLNARDVLLPGECDRMVRNLSRIAAGEHTNGELYTLVTKDKNVMRVLIYTAAIIHDKNFEGFRGSIVDITERLRLQDALNENREMLDGILRASPVGVFRLDPSGHFTYVNETFTTITGMAFERIRGTCWADVISKVEYNRVQKEIAKSARERTTNRVELRYIHPNGTPYWLFGQTVPITDKDGSLFSWVGTITDITEQKLVEDALKENEEKYRALTENTPDILFSTGMDGIITYVSPQVNRYGFLEEEVIGKTLRIFIHPADIDQVERTLSREMEKGAQFVSRFRILDKWGTTFWIEEKSSLRLDQSGIPIGMYGILRDVTERKRVEDAIEIANKKLNLMNQITRHDILNTVTGLFGCVDMTQATDSPEEKEQLLNDIRDLTRVIQRHIAFTREYQEVGVHLPQWQNINNLLNKVVQNFEKSGICFSSEFTKTEIYADPLLEKVFYNLVDNAIRYGETITTISIYPIISDKELLLIFEDDGVGVEDGQKREIFKRGVGKNTGMGLFLTAEILAITDITIEENGIFGKGARFEIRIPSGTWRLFRE